MTELGIFFNRLLEWSSDFRELQHWVKEYDNARGSALQRESLYTSWLENVLPMLGITVGRFSRHAELRPLYTLITQLNPHYFRSDEISSLLNVCTVLTPERRQLLTELIAGFLNLARKTELNPVRMMRPEILTEWWRIFPADNPWELLEWLQEHGVPIPASSGGFRAWRRFRLGALPPQSSHPREWVELCENVGESATPWQVDCASSMFAGEWMDRDIPGPCIEIPRCEACFLKEDCRWFSGEFYSQDDAGVEVMIQHGKLTQTETRELLEWMLVSHPDESEALSNFMGPTNLLRDWDERRLRDLENALPNSPMPSRLRGILELCRRYGEETMTPGVQFSSSHDIFRHYHARFSELKQEQFSIVLLDNKHRFISERTVSIGILNKSLVHPREVFADAVELRAAALICVHNHPSGDPKPSVEDERITRRLVEAGELLGIPVLDHVIIGKEHYTSFADEGKL